jgi:glycosyltransferase involved in cell wall biosynthesis
MIDVIIPVYNAFADVVRCLDSVLRHTPTPARIVVIDDASTDPRIAPYVLQVQAQHSERVVFLQNAQNIGFVQTVNRGMALSTHDVVLLNSDTEVTPQWLERLSACADADPLTATVTPFSNNAEICSYPVFCRNTQVSGLDLSALCETMAQVHDGHYPEIPTAFEQGFTDIQIAHWAGLHAPKGTPEPIIQQMAQAIDAGMKNKEIQDRLKAVGIEPIGGTKASFEQFISQERARLQNVVKATGMTEE